jgi:hypothetical protein
MVAFALSGRVTLTRFGTAGTFTFHTSAVLRQRL